MIKAIIFDLDNTLIDFWRFKTRSVDAAINSMIRAGLNTSKTNARKIIHRLYKKHGMEYKYIFQGLLKEVKGRIDWRILGHALVAYRRTRGNLLVSYRGVKPTLSRLRKKGYKLAIISDAPAIKAWVRLVAMDMDSLFDVVVTFDDTKRRKPHYLPFKNVLEKLKLGPREVMMVGDNIKRDIVGARALGIKTVFARYGLVGKPRKAVKADFQIDKIEDLLKIMNKAK